MSGSSANRRERPLSPHLQVYKPQLTSFTSIMHRFTGMALAVGTLLVTCLLMAAAKGPEAYDKVAAFLGGPLGTFMLLGWTVALYYHLCNGIKHLLQDTGRLLTLCSAYKAGYLVLLATAALTGATWYCAKVIHPNAGKALVLEDLASLSHVPDITQGGAQ